MGGPLQSSPGWIMARASSGLCEASTMASRQSESFTAWGQVGWGGAGQLVLARHVGVCAASPGRQAPVSRLKPGYAGQPSQLLLQRFGGLHTSALIGMVPTHCGTHLLHCRHHLLLQLVPLVGNDAGGVQEDCLASRDGRSGVGRRVSSIDSRISRCGTAHTRRTPAAVNCVPREPYSQRPLERTLTRPHTACSPGLASTHLEAGLRQDAQDAVPRGLRLVRHNGQRLPQQCVH